MSKGKEQEPKSQTDYEMPDSSKYDLERYDPKDYSTWDCIKDSLGGDSRKGK